MDYWSVTGPEGSGGPQTGVSVILHITAAEDIEATAAFHSNSLKLVKQLKSEQQKSLTLIEV